MDIETDGRYGSKRIHQRLGHSQPSAPPNRSSKVCNFWREGRCHRRPCPYLHGEPPHSLVWRNPNAGGGGAGPHSKWGKGRGGGAAGRFPAKVSDRPCKRFLAGSCPYGDDCKFLHSWFVSDSFSLLTPLQGHQKVATGIALPSGSDKLYSGSKDGSVRAWDCQSGQCVGVINMGREVGCMITEGPWLFVGVQDAVKAYNTQSGQELSLAGPAGQVYALVVGNDMLFAGTQDGTILAWKVSPDGNCFEPAASLVGHQLGVVSLVVGAMRLYSGSMDNTIRTIKVWGASETGNLEVTYSRKEDYGVLALRGVHDADAKPVLLCSLNDNSVRLYDLPSFSERGKIFSKEEVRAIQTGPGGLFFTGDGAGELKVWKWSETR